MGPSNKGQQVNSGQLPQKTIISTIAYMYVPVFQPI